MSSEPKIDGRREDALYAELRRRAQALLSGDGRSLPAGRVGSALLKASARIHEEVTSRLDQVPAKQTANFLNEARIGREPARPATIPVAFRLAAPPPAGGPTPSELLAPAETRLMATGDGEPVIFETTGDVSLLAGRIVALRGVDSTRDAIFQPPVAFTGDDPPPPLLNRVLKSGAAAGDTKLQVNPASGLALGMVIRLGAGPEAPQYSIAAVEDDLVTIDPPLAADVTTGLAISAVTAFAPFGAGSRDLQQHSLFLGHATLFDIPSALSLTVRGLNLPASTQWHWWGTVPDEDQPAWRPFRTSNVDGLLRLEKDAGKTSQTEVQGQQSFWLRARLPGASDQMIPARDIRVAVATSAFCDAPQADRCNTGAMDVDYEAIANTTPVVRRTGFYPFGREPRQFDGFYIGCAEALSKAGAEISLCFRFGGPALGPLSAVSKSNIVEIFGVGTDGNIYRVRIGDGRDGLVPLPPLPTAMGKIAPAANIATFRDLDTVYVAVPGETGIAVAQLNFDSDPGPQTVAWSHLSGTSSTQTFRRIALVPDARGVLVAFGLEPAPRSDPPASPGNERANLLAWTLDDPTKPAVVPNVIDLLPLGDAAVVMLVADAGKIRIRRRAAGASDWLDIATVQPSDLPPFDRVAWMPGSGNVVFIAGRSEADKARRLRLIRINFSNQAAITLDHLIDLVDPGEGLPITLEAPDPQAQVKTLPTLRIATSQPKRIIWRGTGNRPEPILVSDPASIDFSANTARQFLSNGRFTIVQRNDFGVLYRDFDIRDPTGAGGQPSAILPVPASRGHLAGGSGIPHGAQYAVFGATNSGRGFLIDRATDGRCLLTPFPRPNQPTFNASGRARFFHPVGQRMAVTPTGQALSLATTTSEPTIMIVLWAADANGNQNGMGIWQLTRNDTSVDEWIRPSQFPDAPAALNLAYDLLEGVFNTAGTLNPVAVDSIEVILPDDPAELRRQVAKDPLYSVYDPSVLIDRLETFKTRQFAVFPHSQLDAGVARLMTTAQNWRSIGPNPPANPTLSWEFWNGSAWWALDTANLIDQTANLLVDGGVFFHVPPDLQPTEVGGRTNHWIRARLVGGDYGQARVVVTTTRVNRLTSRQEVDRDLSTIRAPYVTELRVGYCAREFMLPEVVLTEDSLGTRDQTSANRAGQPVEVFAPVSTVMNPQPDPATLTTGDDGACDDPCPPLLQPPDPNPCDAPGAVDSRQSPCLPCDRIHDGPTQAQPAGFTRGLLLGLEMQPRGQQLTIYADVSGSAAPGKLLVEILRAGRFQRLEAEDATFGLSEPGIIAFALDQPSEPVDLLGQQAYWLRLRPENGEARWSPTLQRLRLNAVVARSVETRTLAEIGASSGEPGQAFRLAQPPVEAGSLALRVRETPGEDERRAMPSDDVRDMLATMPGPWVRWRETLDFSGNSSTARVFTLDPDSGTILFGDGLRGAIPPLGAAIVAETYQRVIGKAANATPAGAELQLVSPIARVDAVLALEQAAGGSDAETSERARARGPAELRRGLRIQTIADIENAALASAPDVAQARAYRWRGGVRLVVALAGSDPLPGPARLRGLTLRLTEAAGYGLSRPNGLTVVAPRPLTVLVDLRLKTDRPERAASVAQAVRRALEELFDVRSGGLQGTGWPLGRLPTPDDVSGALSVIADMAVVTTIALHDSDGNPLPDAITQDRIIRLGEVTFLPPEVIAA